MAKTDTPIVDMGVIVDKASGIKYTYRCFINQPIGYGYIYPEVKDIKYNELEMELLAMPQQLNTMMWDAASGNDANGEPYHTPARVVPIYWDDEGLPNIPIMVLLIYVGILNGDLEVESIEAGYEEDHKALIGIYGKHFNKK